LDLPNGYLAVEDKLLLLFLTVHDLSSYLSIVWTVKHHNDNKFLEVSSSLFGIHHQ